MVTILNYKRHGYKLEIIRDMAKNSKLQRHGKKLEIIRDMITNKL